MITIKDLKFGYLQLLSNGIDQICVVNANLSCFYFENYEIFDGVWLTENLIVSLLSPTKPYRLSSDFDSGSVTFKRQFA